MTKEDLQGELLVWAVRASEVLEKARVFLMDPGCDCSLGECVVCHEELEIRALILDLLETKPWFKTGYPIRDLTG